MAKNKHPHDQPHDHPDDAHAPGQPRTHHVADEQIDTSKTYMPEEYMDTTGVKKPHPHDVPVVVPTKDGEKDILGKRFEISMPYSPTVRLNAKDEYDALQRYKKACGILATEHTAKIVEVNDEVTDDPHDVTVSNPRAG